MIEKARKKLDAEIDFIHLVKKIRFFESALEVLIPAEKRAELRKKAKYVTINSSTDDQKSDQQK